MTEWRSLMREYLLHMQTMGFAVCTLESAAFCLKKWHAWCVERGIEPGQVTAQDIDAFHEALKTMPGERVLRLSGATVDRMMQVVRGLFHWAARRELVLIDPTTHLVLPRQCNGLPPTLTMEDVKRLLTAADNGTLFGLRDRVVLETFYGTGIRRLELLRLDVNDLDLQERKLRVMGKGRRERFVPVGDALAEVMERYLRDCRPQLAGRTGEAALFVAAGGGRPSMSGLATMLGRVGKRVGIRLAAHMLRHAFAVHMLACGADLFEIQALLGHRSIKSTQIYTHISNAIFSRKFRRCHPRGGRITQGDV